MIRVLLVEDNRNYRRVFKDNLAELFPSIIIDEAENGKEALEKINATPPHLIFMDIHLPGANGLQLTQKIKIAFPKIRIVILTGYDLPEYRQAATQHGTDAFFVKDSVAWDEIETLIKGLMIDD